MCFFTGAEVLHFGVRQAEHRVDPVDEVGAADVGRVDARAHYVDLEERRDRERERERQTERD